MSNLSTPLPSPSQPSNCTSRSLHDSAWTHPVCTKVQPARSLAPKNPEPMAAMIGKREVKAATCDLEWSGLESGSHSQLRGCEQGDSVPL